MERRCFHYQCGSFCAVVPHYHIPVVPGVGLARICYGMCSANMHQPFPNYNNENIPHTSTNLNQTLAVALPMAPCHCVCRMQNFNPYAATEVDKQFYEIDSRTDDFESLSAEILHLNMKAYEELQRTGQIKQPNATSRPLGDISNVMASRQCASTCGPKSVRDQSFAELIKNYENKAVHDFYINPYANAGTSSSNAPANTANVNANDNANASPNTSANGAPSTTNEDQEAPCTNDAQQGLSSQNNYFLVLKGDSLCKCAKCIAFNKKRSKSRRSYTTSESAYDNRYSPDEPTSENSSSEIIEYQQLSGTLFAVDIDKVQNCDKVDHQVVLDVLYAPAIPVCGNWLPDFTNDVCGPDAGAGAASANEQGATQSESSSSATLTDYTSIRPTGKKITFQPLSAFKHQPSTSQPKPPAPPKRKLRCPLPDLDMSRFVDPNIQLYIPPSYYTDDDEDTPQDGAHNADVGPQADPKFKTE